jgi:hypothetical protein
MLEFLVMVMGDLEGRNTLPMGYTSLTRHGIGSYRQTLRLNLLKFCEHCNMLRTGLHPVRQVRQPANLPIF